ncbi:MAG: YaiO family outer membrane beta-barrel protein [Ramlibacter sp.]|nr:YaiO family outer membrane beta-barrel protein [Ramlibacter sp.]
MTGALCALVVTTLLPLPLLAQDQPAAVVNRLQLSAEHNRLDHGFRDWNEVTVRYSRQWERRELAEVALTQAHRFGETDRQLEALYVRPLGSRLTASAQLSFSPEHNFLARHSIEAGAQYEFMPAWLVHARLRRTTYDTASVEQGALMLERYAGNYSASLAWRPVQALGTHANGFELRANRYYGDDSNVGVIASSGQEATQVGAGAIQLAIVRSVALVGRHRLDPGWSVNYALSRTRQGSLYSRTGFSAGVQHNF